MDEAVRRFRQLAHRELGDRQGADRPRESPRAGRGNTLDPDPEHVARAVRQDGEGEIHGLAPDRFVPDLDAQGIEEHDRIHRLERARLRGRHLGDHRVGDGADQVGRPRLPGKEKPPENRRTGARGTRFGTNTLNEQSPFTLCRSHVPATSGKVNDWKPVLERGVDAQLKAYNLAEE